MQSSWIVLMCLYLALECVYVIESNGTSHESRLRAELMSQVQTLGVLTRPVQNSTLPMQVYYGMRLISFDVEEASQTLVTNVYVRMKWYDEFLTWDKAEYGGISHVNFPTESLWTPHDVTVVNSIETKHRQHQVDVQVRHDGMVFWSPRRTYRSECFLDLTYYPYDKHTCSIWIQSLAGYSQQLNLELYGKDRNTSATWDLETYMDSKASTQEWVITSNDTKRVTSSRNEGVVLMYSNKVALRFTLGIERRSGFTAYIVMFPSVVLSFLSTIIFCLPPERPDRNMLAMSLFASFMFFLLILANNVPPSAAATPKLVWMYCFNLAVTVGCVMCSVFIINVVRRGERCKPLPVCLHKIFFGIVAKILCVHTIPQSPCKNTKGELSPVKQANGKDSTYFDMAAGNSKSQNEKILDSKEDINIAKQWKTLGLILDRCLFIFFIVINIVAILILFPRKLPKSN